MNVKRKVRVLLSVLLIACICVGSFTVFRRYCQHDSKENPAWLSDVYVRESATDFVKNEMIPRDDGILQPFIWAVSEKKLRHLRNFAN